MKLSNDSKDLKVKNTSPNANTTSAWRYEEKGGILVVVELKDKYGKWIGTSQVLISNAVINSYIKHRE